jgi:methylmalonyl-CoA mutase C-terminal domain/subunit
MLRDAYLKRGWKCRQSGEFFWPNLALMAMIVEVAAALRDAGFEVIYTGLRQTPEQVVAAAIQEDVDAVGMSVLSGAHMTLFPAVLDGLKKEGADHILLFGGGIIAESDANSLAAMGIGRIFTPGASTEEIIGYLNSNLKETKEKIL